MERDEEWQRVSDVGEDGEDVPRAFDDEREQWKARPDLTLEGRRVHRRAARWLLRHRRARCRELLLRGGPRQLDTTQRPLSRCTDCLIDPEDLQELFGGCPIGYPVEPADGSVVRAPGIGLQPHHPLVHRPFVDPVTQQEHGPRAFHAEPCAFLVDDDVFI